MSVTGGILAGVGLAGSIGSAAIGANAAGNAANTQANAANNAANLQYEASQNALQFQEGEYGQSQSNLAPWLASGQSGLANLDYLLGVTPPTTQGAAAGQPGAFTGTTAPIPPPGSVAQPSATGGVNQTNPNTTASVNGPTGTTNLGSMVNPALGAEGSLNNPYPGGQFVAPTAQEALNSPGEQAQLQLGEQALQQSAAARGNLLTGGTAEALNGYAQNLASTNYQNTYNNAYNTYSSNYNQYENQQANEYNRLAALAGTGQTTANNLATIGSSAASGVSNTLQNEASGVGQQLNNAGAANASGIVGSANAWGGALGGSSSNLSNLALMNSLYGSSGGTSTGQQSLNGIQDYASSLGPASTEDSYYSGMIG